jgi:hypothetical protein
MIGDVLQKIKIPEARSLRDFKSNTTGRGAKSENSIAFRSEIKALAKKGRGSKKGMVLKSEGASK